MIDWNPGPKLNPDAYGTEPSLFHMIKFYYGAHDTSEQRAARYMKAYEQQLSKQEKSLHDEFMIAALPGLIAGRSLSNADAAHIAAYAKLLADELMKLR